MVTSTDQPTDQPTDRPTDRQGEYRAICLFRKLENKKKAEICNSNGYAHYDQTTMASHYRTLCNI